MVKNILKNFYLTDEYDKDDNISLDLKKKKNKNKKSKKESKKMKDLEEDIEELSDDSPKIEFIVEEDENKVKQIRMNFEFKIENSNELIKIDLEISRNTYLEIANELLK